MSPRSVFAPPTKRTSDPLELTDFFLLGITFTDPITYAHAVNPGRCPVNPPSY